MEKDATKQAKTGQIGGRNPKKHAETDTNSEIIRLRAELHRLQENVTWQKSVKYGICTYHFIKFWYKTDINEPGFQAAKRGI